MGCAATVSFEVITREVEDFPKKKLNGSQYLVESWGKADPESWFYSTHGLGATYSEGSPILFATMLQGMLPKFTQQVSKLGFQTCRHEEGTWKVHVTWPQPTEEQIQEALRKRRGGRSPSARKSRKTAEPEEMPSPTEVPSDGEQAKAAKKKVAEEVQSHSPTNVPTSPGEPVDA